ncbi:MAG: hypothetical protein [Wendovervirus sonii]|uniref:Uncharacterized protein n=1 Tax=phage Lak_Megaphage_Sonny TaxID=3109229 RepID=A0ABZ0Z6A4_9CAUD|nr:MAG: hypothetical protein [phage Lak_Megaphage_Sonny]
MNENTVYQVVNDYYLHHRTLYENFSGLIQVMPALNEVYHITNMFDKCINDIIQHLNEYTGQYKYTGWNLNNVEKICSKYEDETAYIPIYLRKQYDENNLNALSITDKKFSNDKIQLTINTAFERNNYIYDLHHELFHALQMYIVDNKNLISEEKTHINFDEEKDVIEKRKITNTFLQIADGIIYYCSKSEQNAQLQATIPFLKEHKIYRDKKTTEHIIELISKSEDYNCFYKFKFYFDKIEYWWTSGNKIFYGNLCTLAYFYKKYSGDKLSKDIVIDENFIMNLPNKSESEKEKIAGQIFSIISDNFETYKKKLYDLIFVHCLQ